MWAAWAAGLACGCCPGEPVEGSNRQSSGYARSRAVRRSPAGGDPQPVHSAAVSTAASRDRGLTGKGLRGECHRTKDPRPAIIPDGGMGIAMFSCSYDGRATRNNGDGRTRPRARATAVPPGGSSFTLPKIENMALLLTRLAARGIAPRQFPQRRRILARRGGRPRVREHAVVEPHLDAAEV